MSAGIDWTLAARVATLAAGSEEAPREPAGLLVEGRRAADAVCSYTGLEPRAELPAPEWVSRATWAEINLESMRLSLGPLEQRLGASGDGLPAPVGGALSAGAGALLGAQLGALLGLASRRVLGQLELPVLDAYRPPRLLLVGANIADAQSDLDGSPESVLRWIVLHEVTHAVHFAAVPWLRDHLAGLVRALIEEAEPRISLADLGRAGREVLASDPRATLERLRRQDPLTLLAPAGAREILARTQATMAVVEGFAEHVMDEAAPALGEDVSSLRASMERRREQRAPAARLLAWLLGIELKLRQYREGKRFCDEVVSAAGMPGLARAWSGPRALPGPDELAEPDRWLARTGDELRAA